MSDEKKKPGFMSVTLDGKWIVFQCEKCGREHFIRPEFLPELAGLVEKYKIG